MSKLRVDSAGPEWATSGMSDAQSPEPKHPSPESDTQQLAAGTTAKPNIPPAVALAFVIIALLGVLIVMALKIGSPPAPDIDPDLAKTKAELNALGNEYNRERVAMGLRPLEGSSEPIEDIAARLKKDADSLVGLAGSYQKLLAEKDGEVSARNAEILRSEQIRQSLASECKRLQDDLQRALVSGSDSDLLRRDLADAKAQRDAIAAELADAKEKMRTMTTGASADDYADLKRRYDEAVRAKDFFEAQSNEFKDALSKAKLFASSENELLPAAVELFRSLRALENRPHSDIASEYSSLGVKLGANVLQNFTFPTGSSTLAAEDQDKIRNLVADIPDGDLLLVIGYASETGNVDNNRTLSQARATAVAELYSSVKHPTQLVQAVYLGQTDRFSNHTPERNQLVEIWRIRKK